MWLFVDHAVSGREVIDAIRSFIEVHPILCGIGALVIYGIMRDFMGDVRRMNQVYDDSLDDGLPKDWPRKEKQLW